MKSRKPHKRAPKPTELAKLGRVKPKIIDFVREVRTATTDQIARYLGITPVSVREHLQKLVYNHYLYPLQIAVTHDGRPPAGFILDTLGIKEAQKMGYEDIYTPKKTTSNYKMPHYIGLSEVYLQIRLGIEAIGGEIIGSYPEHFFTHPDNHDRLVINGYKKPRTLRPDWGFILRLPNGKVTILFVEFDCDTENLGVLELKAKCYLKWLETGKYKLRFGYKSFRVLFILDTPGIEYKLRPSNLRNRLEALPKRKRHFWICEYEAFQASQNVLIDPLWSIAGDAIETSLLSPKDFPTDQN